MSVFQLVLDHVQPTLFLIAYTVVLALAMTIPAAIYSRPLSVAKSGWMYLKSGTARRLPNSLTINLVGARDSTNV